jgi:SAM-dependent methyltransferase
MSKVCPVWVGYVLASPLRRVFHNPYAILSPHVREGMTVLDAGCAMGFFSLPLARLVGPSGRVICVDLQKGMIRGLEQRAERAGLIGRLEGRLCSPNNLGVDDLDGKVDFALAFACVHEAPDSAGILGQLAKSLKIGGRCLLAEPRGHVTTSAFEKTVALAEAQSLVATARPEIIRCRAAQLEKMPVQ